MATFDERAKDWDTPERIARAAEAADAIRANVALAPTDRVATVGSKGVDEGRGHDDAVRPGPGDRPDISRPADPEPDRDSLNGAMSRRGTCGPRRVRKPGAEASSSATHQLPKAFKPRT